MTTKAAFIRSIPLDTPVNEVIRVGAEQGLQVRAQDVYHARSLLRNANRAPAPGSVSNVRSILPFRELIPPLTIKERELRKLVLELGTDSVVRVLESMNAWPIE